MNIFNNKDIEDSKLHEKYLKLKNAEFYVEERKIIEDWSNDFIDRDNKIVTEFQTTFHSSFWEFYLFAVFKEMKFDVNFNYDRPDFILENQGIKMYVEATISNIRASGKKESERNFGNYMNILKPPHLWKDFDENITDDIVRYSNSIQSKMLKYEKDYKNLEWIQKDAPFALALSSYSQVDYGRSYVYGIIALLYGFLYHPKTHDFLGEQTIKKTDSNAQIEINIFGNEKYKNISAVLFSTTTTLGKLESMASSKKENDRENHIVNLYRDYYDEKIPYKINLVSTESPEELTDGFFVFHNPNAAVKLPFNIFYHKGITQYYINEKGMLEIMGNYNPTISRLSFPKQMQHIFWSEIDNDLEAWNTERFGEELIF